MMAIVSLLPILIVIGLIIFFVLLNKRFKMKPVTFQKSKWIIIGYVSILLVAAICSLFLPSTKAKVVDNNIDEDWENSYYQQALNGNFSSIDSKGIKKSWEFPLTGNTLSFHLSNYEQAFIIERNSDLQDKVEVYYIENWHVMEVGSVKVDISDFIPEVDITVEQNVLRVIGTGTANVKMAYTDPDFTMIQFLSEYDSGFGYAGSSFFYVRVPENLNIENAEEILAEEINN